MGLLHFILTVILNRLGAISRTLQLEIVPESALHLETIQQHVGQLPGDQPGRHQDPEGLEDSGPVFERELQDALGYQQTNKGDAEAG